MNTKVDKRELFVAIGCEKFPYEKIKELFNHKDEIALEEFMALPVRADEKVVALQEMKIFPEGLQRIIAFYFARATFQQGKKHLTNEEVPMVEKAHYLMGKILLGETPVDKFEIARKRIISYLKDELYTLKDSEEAKVRIGVFEILLSVFKLIPDRALSEASSIQRYLFGEEKIAEEQLEDFLRFAKTYNL